MIKLDDGKPWFRRWAWIGYWPITREGWLVTYVGSSICLVTAVLALLIDGRSPWTEILFGVAFVAVLAVNAIGFYKREDIYF